MKIFDELEGRLLVKQTTGREELRQLLNEEGPITFYIGFDPTADSLHVGHLLQVLTAKRLMEAGHRPIMLVGGATALVGDPTGKTDMRKMMSHSEIRVNTHAIHKQIEKLMGFPVHCVNNLEWFEGAGFLHVIRDIGKHFSVNNMLRSDCFKSRMENGGLSFLEFNYMIMQATDFNWLHKANGCILQIGGDDQWSNILAGVDLVHKISGDRVFGLTLPLLIDSNGNKMGKTEKGAVWLDPEKTSPFDFFQFWRNIPDSEVLPCFRKLTFLTFQEIMRIPFANDIKQINDSKKRLAFEITKIVHGEDAAQEAQKRAEALFESQDTSELEAFEIQDGMHILDLLVGSVMAKSRTDARNLINGKGVSINDEVLTDPTINVTISRFGERVMLRKGKKHHRLFHLRAKHE